MTNPAPTATNDSGATTENATSTGNVLSNDTDPDNDTLTVLAVNGVAGNVRDPLQVRTAGRSRSMQMEHTAFTQVRPLTTLRPVRLGQPTCNTPSRIRREVPQRRL